MKPMKKTIKKLAKKLLIELWAKDMGSISLKNEKLISFDIFDTLIQRKTGSPETVFDVTEQKACRELGQEFSDFAKIRKAAERTLRKQYRNSEITLEEIYSEIKRRKCWPDKACSKLMDMEMQTELEVCRPVKRMKRFYYDALKKDKRVIITSDMYLSQELIEKILFRCGYAGYEKLFLSSTYKATKARGRLFHYILKEYQIPARQLLHIGDNPWGDFLIPRWKGIRAVLIKNAA